MIKQHDIDISAGVVCVKGHIQFGLFCFFYLQLPMEQLVSCGKSPGGAKCLEEFKYYFNKEGELRHMDTNEPFVFNYYKNEPERNHKRYQVLGHMITQYVYELLEKECELQKVHIPLDAQSNEPQSCFFMSKEALTNPLSLIILLQDYGVVRAGQWGQKTIIHHGLDQGTQIPFIKIAKKEYGGIIVLNPNDNFLEMKVEEPEMTLIKKESSLSTENDQDTAMCNKQLIPKRCCSTAEEHTIYVWDHFISKSLAKKVAFITHGYGGLTFVDLLMRRKEVMSKVFAVAFIDSKHNTQHQVGDNAEVQDWIRKHCKSWVLSSKALDRPTGSVLRLDCPRVSAGTENHELAPFCSLQPIFRFLSRSSEPKTNAVNSRTRMVTRSSVRNKNPIE
ncbi:putative protein FAM172B isoform X2 [Microcaecilia unicolor]|uniref:Arb2 domain-containing protein n=1 Tax=Microcaecilia unicolor TaxID=1415580 RepID=A0A6P7YB01_9AMPH|nr:putative protein FAM172B isoform X2 [Microcaecilia unicolor]